MPSRPLTDANKEIERIATGVGKAASTNIKPVSETPTASESRIVTGDSPTKILTPERGRKKASAAAFDETITHPVARMSPDLVQSLHTAVRNVQPKARKDTTSIEDMNILLKLLGFHCHRLLGSGGMGSVFLATDTKLQRRVAIKVLLPTLSGDYQFTQLFLKEAETVAKFGHENIVQIYAIHVVQGIYFIVMEFVEGVTIRDKIRREGRISEPETLRIIDQVSRALVHTHAHGIIHRDIKPQNVLLTAEGVPKVADFGLAISVRESLREGATSAGTPTYMAPEQARGEIATSASDIYSLGVVMYFMLTGKIPYRATSVQQVLKEISAGNRIDVAEATPDLSRTVVKVVRKAMEPRPQNRFIGMQEFNEAVRNAWLSYQRRGLKPMLPRVKRAAWMWLAPPVCLIAGLLLGYLVHNPTAEKTSLTYHEVLTPRVKNLQRTLAAMWDQETDDRVRIQYNNMITSLDDALKKEDPSYLIKVIGDVEFCIDWYGLKSLLLKLRESRGLSGPALAEANALWEAAQKKDREAFYKHRTLLFDLLGKK